MNHIQLLCNQVSRRIGTLTEYEQSFIAKNWQSFEGSQELAQEIQELRTPLYTSLECRRNDGRVLTLPMRDNSSLTLQPMG